MAMQSALIYGRLLASQARQFVAPLLGSSHNTAKLRLISACCGLSKDFVSERRKFVFGEDAYFIAENFSLSALGVADGVGGWRQYGVDSSLFSSALMEGCKQFALEGGLQVPSPLSIIKAAYKELTEHKAPLFGSSTACIVLLDKKSQTLHSANLGDSGFLVIRAGAVVHESSEQQHYFNTPYQVAVPPPDQEGAVIQDSLDEAENMSISVQEGDLIVMATDGLFDNLSKEQILQEVAHLKDGSLAGVQAVADSLANLAQECAFDPSYVSPFAREAHVQGLPFTGGKPDDITVLIALVSLEEESSEV